jgi:hypothetical protein
MAGNRTLAGAGLSDQSCVKVCVNKIYRRKVFLASALAFACEVETGAKCRTAQEPIDKIFLASVLRPFM